jgi:hypothetical protein
MSKIEWKKSIGTGARLLLAFVFLLSQTVWGGQSQQTKDKSDSQQKTTVQRTTEQPSSALTTAKQQTEEAQGETSEKAVAEEKPSGDGSHEGIKVHGHWTIEVRNPDGTLVTHREFENSLAQGANSGSQLLAEILNRQVTVNFWAVVLTTTGICNAGEANQQLNECIIYENYPFSTTFGSIANTLTVSPPNNGLTFNGYISAPGTGQITGVGTYLYVCSPSVSPQACFGGQAGESGSGSGFVTSASVTQSVQSGQTISVTVVISFS